MPAVIKRSIQIELTTYKINSGVIPLSIKPSCLMTELV